ncbi:MAG: antitoxin [Clostridiales Family XIII bacterium]|jgi:antitoxin VapB|nr:antitoxin [Clostridiales Family XIII bacterium]
MRTAKLFTNGKSQGVRLPKEYRFEGSEVCVQKIGSAVIIFPKDKAAELMFSGMAGFSEDFMAENRDQGRAQKREGF